MDQCKVLRACLYIPVLVFLVVFVLECVKVTSCHQLCLTCVLYLQNIT